MQLLNQHTITKIIQKSGSVRDYYCEEHNASYPTLESLRLDHPNLNESKIISFKKGERVSAMTYPKSLQHIKEPPSRRSKI